MLGIEPRSSERAQVLLTTEPSLQPDCHFNIRGYHFLSRKTYNAQKILDLYDLLASLDNFAIIFMGKQILTCKTFAGFVWLSSYFIFC